MPKTKKKTGNGGELINMYAKHVVELWACVALVGRYLQRDMLLIVLSTSAGSLAKTILMLLEINYKISDIDTSEKGVFTVYYKIQIYQP